MPRFPLLNKAQIPKTWSTGNNFSQKWILKLEASLLNPRRGRTCSENVSHQEVHIPNIKLNLLFFLEKRFPPSPLHLHTWKGIEQELRPLDLNSSPAWEALSLQHPLARGALGAPGQGWSNCRSRQGEAEAEPWSRSSLEACFVRMISISDSNQKHFASLCSEVHRRSLLPSELLLLLYIHSYY